MDHKKNTRQIWVFFAKSFSCVHSLRFAVTLAFCWQLIFRVRALRVQSSSNGNKFMNRVRVM